MRSRPRSTLPTKFKIRLSLPVRSRIWGHGDGNSTSQGGMPPCRNQQVDIRSRIRSVRSGRPASLRQTCRRGGPGAWRQGARVGPRCPRGPQSPSDSLQNRDSVGVAHLRIQAPVFARFHWEAPAFCRNNSSTQSLFAQESSKKLLFAQVFRPTPHSPGRGHC